MKTSAAAAALLFLSTCAAQTPDFSGVWQADIAKSHFAGPPVTQYLMIIEQHGPKLRNRLGVGFCEIGRNFVPAPEDCFELSL